MMDECFEYDDELRREGHFAGGEALADPSSAVTLYRRENGVSSTDGPFEIRLAADLEEMIAESEARRRVRR